MSDQQRLMAIYERVVSTLQQVVLDFDVTEDELKAAGHFFNRMGKEDLMANMMNIALSMTVVGKARAGRSGTRQNLEGPYYVPGSPVRPDGVLYEREPGENAVFLDWSGALLDAETGEPLPSGELDVWQADENGDYDHAGFHLKGVIRPDDNGRFAIHTVVPRDYAEHDEDSIGELLEAIGRGNHRAAHIHVKARAPGYRTLTTQLFIPLSEHLDHDYVEGAVSPDLTFTLADAGTLRGRSRLTTTFDIELAKP